MKITGNADRQETGSWLNNRAENSHLPFRRRKRVTLRSRRMQSLQKFASVHASGECPTFCLQPIQSGTQSL